MKHRYLKLNTPCGNITDNHPHDNEDYDASFFVEEDDKFPGYVKLSLAEVKTNSVYLDRCTIMYDDKLNLSNSMIMDSVYKRLVKTCIDDIPVEYYRFIESFQIMDINGPAQTINIIHKTVGTAKSDYVMCIHYDAWPNSANSFITRRKANN